MINCCIYSIKFWFLEVLFKKIQNLLIIKWNLPLLCSKISNGGANGGGAVSADPAERRGNALAALRALCDSAVLQPYLMQLLLAK